MDNPEYSPDYSDIHQHSSLVAERVLLASEIGEEAKMFETLNLLNPMNGFRRPSYR